MNVRELKRMLRDADDDMEITVTLDQWHPMDFEVESYKGGAIDGSAFADVADPEDDPAEVANFAADWTPAFYLVIRNQQRHVYTPEPVAAVLSLENS